MATSFRKQNKIGLHRKTDKNNYGLKRKGKTENLKRENV
jgi:hypothetical protein